MNLWHPNCCEAFVVPADTGSYAVITNRKECWQGLEQNITERVSTGSTYTVCAFVGVSGAISGCTDVQATLKVEYRDSATSYVFIGRYSFPSYYACLLLIYVIKPGVIMEILHVQKTCF